MVFLKYKNNVFFKNQDIANKVAHYYSHWQNKCSTWDKAKPKVLTRNSRKLNITSQRTFTSFNPTSIKDQIIFFYIIENTKKSRRYCFKLTLDKFLPSRKGKLHLSHRYPNFKPTLLCQTLPYQFTTKYAQRLHLTIEWHIMWWWSNKHF